MSETPASEDDFSLKRENLAEDGSSGAVDASSLTPEKEAHAALTEPRLVMPGDSEQATEKQRQPRRGGSVGAIVAAALLVSLMSYALLHLAPVASGSRQGNVFTADSSATVTPTSTETASATATATTAPTATRASNVAPGRTPDNFTVESISSAISAGTDGFPGMTASSNTSGASFTGGCGQRIFITLNFTLTLSALPQKRMTIDYYVRHSDGTSDGTASQPVEPTWGSPATTNTLTTSSDWIMPYTQATGAPQWVELDVLRPNPLTERMDFTTNCPFTPSFPQVSASPARYDCTTGGSQAFTVTGALTASLTSDTSPHTVTYHWQRADGSVTPDQTVTFAPGVTQMSIPSDTASITFQTGSLAPDNTYSIDKLIVTDGAGHTMSNDATIKSAC
ncbi:MAG TPA: hypothetical protein VFN78_14110 [Ktedonobacterales bacterium]|nr:hypothetical protein [Ktedonobacterales bacterium]